MQGQIRCWRPSAIEEGMTSHDTWDKVRPYIGEEMGKAQQCTEQGENDVYSTEVQTSVLC